MMTASLIVQLQGKCSPMEHLITILVFTTLAGAAIPVGGLFARFERLQPRWLEQEFRHAVLAFGGGVLFAAVALILVPEGSKRLSTLVATGSFVIGGVVFMFLDRALAKHGSPASNLTAALLDFAPESIALGALIASDPSLGIVLAFFIALQNLPEGFNAYREMVNQSHMGFFKVLSILSAGALIGPICGLLGFFYLADDPVITAVIMMFAAGGILYLVFQDVAPQAKLSRHWAPPLGAVLGFALGLIGEMMLVH
jgi:ZIP family zinc transporter